MKYSDLFRATGGIVPAGYTIIGSIQDSLHDVWGLWSDDGKTMVIGFGGTLGDLFPHPSLDWLNDAKFWHEKAFLGGMRYRGEDGFVSQYLAEALAIKNWVRVYQPDEILVAGFSKGGALMALCVADLIEVYPGRKIVGIGFGSPRAFDECSSETLESIMERSNGLYRIEQYRVWGDPVPDALPWFLGYRHVGKVRYVGPYRLIPSFMIPNPYHNATSYPNDLEALGEFVV